MKRKLTFEQKRAYIGKWMGLESGTQLLMSIADADYWYTKIKLQKAREQATKRKLSTDGKHD